MAVTTEELLRRIEELEVRLDGVPEHTAAPVLQLWRVTADNEDDTYDLAAAWDATTNQTNRVRAAVPSAAGALAVDDVVILGSRAQNPRALLAFAGGGGGGTSVYTPNPATLGVFPGDETAQDTTLTRVIPPIGTVTETWTLLWRTFDSPTDQKQYGFKRKIERDDHDITKVYAEERYDIFETELHS